MLFFDEMSKERKIQKDTEQSEKEWEKQKNTKIQSVFLAAKDKNKKKYKVQGVFFRNFWYLFCIFCIFTKKVTKKNTNPKSPKYKKNKQTQNLENTKIRKMQTQRKKNRPTPCSLSEKHPNRREK